MVKKIVNNDMSEVLASKCALVVFRLPGVGLQYDRTCSRTVVRGKRRCRVL